MNKNKKTIKKTPFQWYKELWSINNAFKVLIPSKKVANKKITREWFERKYKI